MFETFDMLSAEQQLELIVRPRGDWYGVSHVASGVLRVLPELEWCAPVSFDSGKLTEICEQLVRGTSVYEWLKVTEAPQGISGLKTDFPQHAGLHELGKRKEIEPARRYVAAMLVIWTADWQRRLHALPNDDPKKQSQQALLDRRLVEAWMAVRLLRGGVIGLLEAHGPSPLDFILSAEGTLLDYDVRTVDEDNRRYLGYLNRYFSAVLGRSQTGGSGVVRFAGNDAEAELQVEEELSIVDADGEIHRPELRVYQNRRSLQERRKTDHFRAGNAIQEIEDGPTLVQSVGVLETAKGETPVQSVLRRRGQLLHRRRSAQVLPGRWDELNQHEVSTLLQFAYDHYSIESELTSTLLLMLLTGRSFEDVRAARVVNGVAQLPLDPSPSAVYLVYEKQAWGTGALKPAARRKRESRWQDYLRHHQDVLMLPVPSPLWCLLAPLIKTAATRSRERSARLFHADRDLQIEEQIRDALSRLNSGRQARLTLHRIEHQLFAEVMQQSTDVTEAALITGKQAPYGESAALYYHSCDRETLVDCYTKVANAWAHLLTDDDQWKLIQRDMIGGSVGSDLVLDDAAGRLLVADLRAQLKVDRKLLGSPEGLQRFHNAYTNYCLVMLFFATGYRAVGEPVARESDVNIQAGFITIADKTGDGFGHARMVPLCALLSAQISAYQSHVHWLTQHLAWSGSPAEDTPFLFYLESDLKSLRVRPRSMNTRLSWSYPESLPLNLSRHWLRGALRARGVPGSTVDQFMGHWSAGQEPWSKYSGIDPMHFGYQLSAVLDGLLHDLGFECEVGAV
ncbi:hypothetical protein [Mangrovitalea sediminis]|uniref:hypothetical protein n=1 Tax=Mangrovitalea sediminis TaxID=1982043 RepID=UPI000BE62253|nr:hypothetical protein [Mangrovitalea sediminis]